MEGDENSLNKVETSLLEIGYLQKEFTQNIMLIEFKLLDIPGSVQKILKLITQFNFNISYISSQENNTAYQYFRMGLLVENPTAVSEFINMASKICERKILDDNHTEKTLDNTMIYIGFLNTISKKHSLNGE